MLCAVSTMRVWRGYEDAGIYVEWIGERKERRRLDVYTVHGRTEEEKGPGKARPCEAGKAAR